MQFRFRANSCALLLAAGVALPAAAKPIAFADGTTFMHERDSNMVESAAFYAPKYWWSAGVANGFMTSDDKRQRHEYNYVQGNLLLKRWNLPDAQGNLFASAGVGTATGRDFSGTVGAQRYGIQGDYETRRIYTSFKIDVHTSSRYFDRYDVAQFGWSPYAHDYDDLAVWFVAQVKKYRGMDDKTEGGAFLRLFKGNIWVEIGMTEGRKSQLMLMINY